MGKDYNNSVDIAPAGEFNHWPMVLGMERMMTDEEWVLVDTIEGQLQAEIIRGLLEAQGITVYLNPQGAARAYAVTIGELGAVEVLVPSSGVEKARQTLAAYYRGDFENIELSGSEDESGPTE